MGAIHVYNGIQSHPSPSGRWRCYAKAGMMPRPHWTREELRMRIHHLSCGTCCPLAGRFVPNFPREMICHCLLVEAPDGLVLIDTGLGREDALDPKGRLGWLAATSFGMRPTEGLTAHEQIRDLGHDPQDVRHVIVTHLDYDHCGGLGDFPEATVHVMAAELEQAEQRPSSADRLRYLAHCWAHGPRWARHEVSHGEPWFGFEAVRELPGLPPEFLLVPLPGHSRGHAGVAIDRGAEGWMLHAGDAYYDRRELTAPVDTWLRRMVGRSIHHDIERLAHNQARLAELLARDEAIDLFSSHDPSELPTT